MDEPQDENVSLQPLSYARPGTVKTRPPMRWFKQYRPFSLMDALIFLAIIAVVYLIMFNH